MNNLLKILIIILSAVFFLSCEKSMVIDDCVPNCPTDTTSVKKEWQIVWKNTLDETPELIDSLFFTSNPIIHNGDLFYTRIYPLNFNENDILYKVNGETGDTLWNIVLNGNWVSNLEVFKDNVIVRFSNNTYCYNAINGELKWRHDITSNNECGEGLMSLIDNYIYTIASQCNFPQQSYQKLIRINIENGLSETILKFERHDEEDQSPFIGEPSKSVDINGDEILYFTTHYITTGGPETDDNLSYYAYNLTKKEVLWVKENYENAGTSDAPIIDGDKVYFHGGVTLYCFDKHTGEALWNTKIPDQILWAISKTDPFIIGDLYILNPNNYKILAINKHTGEIVWYHENSKIANVRYFVEYNDAIYFDCYVKEGLFKLDPSTGEVLKRILSPHANLEGAFHHNGIVINEEKGYLYATDGVYLICYDINE